MTYKSDVRIVGFLHRVIYNLVPKGHLFGVIFKEILDAEL